MRAAVRLLTVVVLVVLLCGVDEAVIAQDFGGGGGGGGIGSGGVGSSSFTAALRSFDAGKDGMWLNGLETRFASVGGIGGGDPPWAVFIVDSTLHVIRAIELPSALVRDSGVTSVPLPSIQVPRQFGVAVIPPMTLQLATEGGVAAPTSSSWQYGQPPTPLQGKDWVMKPGLSEAPVTDPQAADLVILNGGEAFFDRFVKGGGNPPVLTFARHGDIPATNLAVLNLGAAVTPTEELWAVVEVRHTAETRGKLISADEKTIVIDEHGQQRVVPREIVESLSFQRVLVYPGPQGAYRFGGGSRGGGY